MSTTHVSSNFFYDGVLQARYADNAPAHSRDDVDTIKRHLMQDDQPWHYYAAQLIHYGMMPTSIKNTAMARFWPAITGGALVVPAAILSKELDLAAEWISRTSVASAAQALAGTNRDMSIIQYLIADSSITDLSSSAWFDTAMEIDTNTSVPVGTPSVPQATFAQVIEVETACPQVQQHGHHFDERILFRQNAVNLGWSAEFRCGHEIQCC